MARLASKHINSEPNQSANPTVEGGILGVGGKVGGYDSAPGGALEGRSGTWDDVKALGDLSVESVSSMVMVPVMVVPATVPVSGTLVSRVGYIEPSSDMVSVIVGLNGALEALEEKRSRLASAFLRRASFAKLSIKAWYLRICQPS